MARVLTITANPLLDYIADGPITAGTVNRVDAIRPAAEGKAVNVGRVLTAHGHEVLCTGFAGGASGTLFRDLVEAAGMQARFCATADALRVGFMAPAPAGGSPTTVIPAGFAVSTSEARALLAIIVELLPSVDLVIASGSVPDTSLDQLYRDLLSACATAGKPCWLDAYGPAMDVALAGPHAPALVKPNAQEWASSEHWQHADEIHRTDGGAQTTIIRGEQRWRLTPPPVIERNPIGCGDCYVAGLAHARLSGLDDEATFAYAAACGAANAARDDVAAITPADIEPLAANAQIETLSA